MVQLKQDRDLVEARGPEQVLRILYIQQQKKPPFSRSDLSISKELNISRQRVNTLKMVDVDSWVAEAHRDLVAEYPNLTTAARTAAEKLLRINQIMFQEIKDAIKPEFKVEDI